MVYHGDGQPMTVGSLIPTSDHGFLLSGTVLRSANSNIYLKRYSSNLTVQWELELGSDQVEEFKYMKVLANGDIILGGYSSLSPDNIPSTSAKMYLYLVRISSIGKVVWEKHIDIDPNDNNYYEVRGTYHLLDITEKQNGELHVASAFETTEYLGTIGLSYCRGCYLATDGNGAVLKQFVMTAMPHAIDFVDNKTLILAHDPYDFLSGSFIGAVYYFNLQTGGTNNYKYLDTLDYRLSNSLPYGAVSSYRVHLGPNQLTTDFIRPNAIIRLNYSVDQNKTTVDVLSPPVEEILNINCLNGSHYLIQDSTGKIVLCDLNLNILKTISSSYFGYDITQLTDGSFVLAYPSKGSIRVIKLDPNGHLTD